MNDDSPRFGRSPRPLILPRAHEHHEVRHLRNVVVQLLDRGCKVGVSARPKSGYAGGSVASRMRSFCFRAGRAASCSISVFTRTRSFGSPVASSGDQDRAIAVAAAAVCGDRHHHALLAVLSQIGKAGAGELRRSSCAAGGRVAACRANRPTSRDPENS